MTSRFQNTPKVLTCLAVAATLSSISAALVLTPAGSASTSRRLPAAKDAALTPARACNVDAIGGIEPRDGLVKLSVDGRLDVRGWAVDEGKKMVPSQVAVRFVGKSGAWEAEAQRTVRPDVVQAFKVPQYEHAGFLFRGSASGLDLGQYSVWIRQGNLVCDAQVVVRIEAT